jgi:hypothetical protein
MPSPGCQIPSTIIPSDILLPLANNDGRAFLPTSIPAGHSATSEDFAQVLLATPTINPRSRESYTATADVGLRATMPWLDRELTNFEVRKNIIIQYPLDLREAKGLASVTHGMMTEISWQVNMIYSVALVDACTDGRSRSSTKAIFASAAEDFQYVKQEFVSLCQLKTGRY